jgi:hypothetical protein
VAATLARYIFNTVHFQLYFFVARLSCVTMDKITIKKPNPECRFYWCLIEFRDTVNHVGIFNFSQIGAPPLTFSLVDPPPPPPGVCVYTVCKREGAGIRMCGEPLQEFYTVYLTRFQTYKIALPTTSNKNLGEKGAFRAWCLDSYFVHVCN